MKKLSLLLSMLLFVVCAFAQKERFGLRVGVAIPKDIGADVKSDSFTLNYFKSLDYKPTLSGGFYINSRVGKFFWFKHEVNYINRGHGFTDSSGTKLKVNEYYVDIYPLNAAFHFKGAQIFAGPSVSFLVAKTQERVNSSGKIVVDKSNLDEEERNIAELGFVAGVEYEFFFGLNLGVRYVGGLTSQYQQIKGEPKVKIFSEVWLFSLGFTFGANKKPATNTVD